MPVSETEFQHQVVDLAHIHGWRHNHTRRTIGKHRQWVTGTSCVGWPDLEMWHVKQHRIVYAELKTDTGKLSVEQGLVLAELTEAGAHVHLWRPQHLQSISDCLAGHCPGDTFLS